MSDEGGDDGPLVAIRAALDEYARGGLADKESPEQRLRTWRSELDEAEQMALDRALIEHLADAWLGEDVDVRVLRAIVRLLPDLTLSDRKRDQVQSDALVGMTNKDLDDEVRAVAASTLATLRGFADLGTWAEVLGDLGPAVLPDALVSAARDNLQAPARLLEVVDHQADHDAVGVALEATLPALVETLGSWVQVATAFLPLWQEGGSDELRDLVRAAFEGWDREVVDGSPRFEMLSQLQTPIARATIERSIIEKELVTQRRTLTMRRRLAGPAAAGG